MRIDRSSSNPKHMLEVKKQIRQVQVPLADYAMAPEKLKHRASVQKDLDNAGRHAKDIARKRFAA